MSVRSEVPVHIGTSGWSYPHWRGAFYPDDLPAGRFLAYYAARLRSVEINNTFYRLPNVQVCAEWREETPPDFLFAAKASRYITHMKKLRDPQSGLGRFLQRMEVLEDKLGPVLFQLPPHWRLNLDRLAAFLEALPPGFRYAMEFRDPSWFDPQVYALLTEHGVAFCNYDLDGRVSPLIVSADFVYVRLHGPREAYRGNYDGRALAAWARRIQAWRAQGKAVHCYFDNDESAYAVHNALRLQARLNSRHAVPTLVP